MRKGLTYLALVSDEWTIEGFYNSGVPDKYFEYLDSEIWKSRWEERRRVIINEPSDTMAPDWANWKAQEMGGVWWWYARKPYLVEDGDIWVFNGEDVELASRGEIPEGHDWTKTKKRVIRNSNGILDEMKFFHIPDRDEGSDTEWGDLAMPEELTLNLKELYDSLGRESNGDGTINLEDIIIHATVRNYGGNEYYPMTSALSYKGIDYAVQHGESFSVLKFKREVEGTSKSSGMNVVKIKSPIAFPALVEGMRQYNTSNSHSLEDYIEGWMDGKGIKWYSITLGEQKG